MMSRISPGTPRPGFGAAGTAGAAGRPGNCTTVPSIASSSWTSSGSRSSSPGYGCSLTSCSSQAGAGLVLGPVVVVAAGQLAAGDGARVSQAVEFRVRLDGAGLD